MTDLFIFNDEDVLLCTASNTSQDSLIFWDADFTESINNASLFEFKIRPNHEWSEYIIERNQVAFKDKDGHLRLFTIIDTEISVDSNGEYIRAICDDAVKELDAIFEGQHLFHNETVGAMLGTLLSRSRWSVGEVAPLGNKSINLFNISVLQALGKLLKLFTGEMRVRIEVQNNRISRRLIDVVSLGVDTGLVLGVGHNVDSLNMDIETGHIRSAIKPLGRSISLTEEEQEQLPDGYTRRTNIRGVTGTVAEHGFDKPTDSPWVEDHEARLLYGINRDGQRQHLEEVVDFSGIEDQEELMIAAWNHLQTINKPHYYIEINMIDLASLAQGEYDHEKLRLGDVVRLVDRDRFTKPIIIESRVILVEYDLNNPELTVIHLGNHRNLYSNDDRLLDLEREVSNGSGQWGRPNVSGDNINPAPQTITGFEATGLFATININWDLQSLGMQYEIHASEVQGFTPSTANMIARINNNGFNHAVETNNMWYYRVRAINNRGEVGDWSNEVSASTRGIGSEDLKQEVRDGIENAINTADNAMNEAQQSRELAQSGFDESQRALEQIGSVDARIDDLIQVMEDFDLDDLVDLVQAIEGSVDGLLEALDEIGARVEVAENNATLALQTAQGFQQIVIDMETGIRSDMTQLADEFTIRIGNNRDAIGALQVSYNGIAGRVTDAEDNIGSLTLRADGFQTEIFTPDGESRITQLGNQIHQEVIDREEAVSGAITTMANNINLAITDFSDELDGNILSRINLSEEGILIEGDRIKLDGRTYITEGIILDAHIDSLSVNKLTAGNFNADWINFGTMTGVAIDAVDITGSRFQTTGTGTTVDIEHGRINVGSGNQVFTRFDSSGVRITPPPHTGTAITQGGANFTWRTFTWPGQSPNWNASAVDIHNTDFAVVRGNVQGTGNREGMLWVSDYWNEVRLRNTRVFGSLISDVINTTNNEWVNLTLNGTNFWHWNTGSVARVRRNNGMVEVQLDVTARSGGFAGIVGGGAIVATLPVGWRPSHTVRTTTTIVGVNQRFNLVVESNGNVVIARAEGQIIQGEGNGTGSRFFNSLTFMLPA